MLIPILVMLLLLGLVCVIINVVPIDARFKTVAYAVVCVLGLIWLLHRLPSMGLKL